MSKTHRKISFYILILMMVYSCTLLFLWYVPYLLNVVEFYNREEIEYGIIGGYISNSFMQSKILYHFICGLLGITFLICLIIVLALFLLKKNMNRIFGIAIISQNIALILFQAWPKYFVNRTNDTITIDIKLWLAVVLIITGICILLSIKQAIFYLLLSIVSMLQLLNTVTLVVENKASISVPQVAFRCFNGIVIPILYWIFLILNTSKGKQCMKDT